MTWHELSVNAILQELLDPKSCGCDTVLPNNIFSYLETLFLIITHEIPKNTGMWRITSKLGKSHCHVELEHNSNKQLKGNQGIKKSRYFNKGHIRLCQKWKTHRITVHALSIIYWHFYLFFGASLEPSQTLWEIITIRTTGLLGTAFIQMKSIRTVAIH